jgi:hypothetical protein
MQRAAFMHDRAVAVRRRVRIGRGAASGKQSTREKNSGVHEPLQ